MVTRPIRTPEAFVVEYDTYHGWIARGFNGNPGYGHDTKKEALEEANEYMDTDRDVIGILVKNQRGEVQRFKHDTYRIELAGYSGEIFDHELYVIHPRAEIDYPDNYGNWGVGIGKGEDLLAFEQDIQVFDTKAGAVEWAETRMTRNRKFGVFKYTSNYRSTFTPNLSLIKQLAR